jgi:Transposase
MEVMIGVDPHKGSHTATMLDRGERELARITVRAGGRQVAELLAWANGHEPRTWAVECAGGMGYLLSQQLVAAGERVLDVPATLASRVRVLGCGQSTKTDPNDARSLGCRGGVACPDAGRGATGRSRHGVPVVGQATHRHGSLADQAVLSTARPRRRARARRDRQGSRRQPGTITARRYRARRRGGG